MSIEYHHHLGAYAVLTNIPMRACSSTKKCICGAIPKMKDTYCPDCDRPVEHKEGYYIHKYYDELFDNAPKLAECCVCIDERDDSYGCTIITNYTNCKSKHPEGEITHESMNGCISIFVNNFRELLGYLGSQGIVWRIKFGYLTYKM